MSRNYIKLFFSLILVFGFFLLENLSGFFQIIHNPFLGSVNLTCFFRLELLLVFQATQWDDIEFIFSGFNSIKEKKWLKINFISINEKEKFY